MRYAKGYSGEGERTGCQVVKAREIPQQSCSGSMLVHRRFGGRSIPKYALTLDEVVDARHWANLWEAGGHEAHVRKDNCGFHIRNLGRTVLATRLSVWCTRDSINVEEKR